MDDETRDPGAALVSSSGSLGYVFPKAMVKYIYIYMYTFTYIYVYMYLFIYLFKYCLYINRDIL